MNKEKRLRILGLTKDLIQEGDINQTNLGPKLLNDPVIQAQFRNQGYAIIQIGDRLVRVYRGPQHDTKIDESAIPTALANIQTGSVQPDAYSSKPVGQDPRYEMSAWDNLERGRNQTKAILRAIYAKQLEEKKKHAIQQD